MSYECPYEWCDGETFDRLDEFLGHMQYYHGCNPTSMSDLREAP